MPHTLDELGILYDGIERERVRQIENKDIKLLGTLLCGEMLKRIDYSASSDLIEHFFTTKSIIHDRKAVKRGWLRDFWNSSSSTERWENLLIDIMGFRIINANMLDESIIITNEISKPAFEKELSIVYKILSDDVTGKNESDLIITAKKDRRKADTVLIKLALTSLPTVVYSDGGEETYCLKPKSSMSAGNIAYHILREHGEPMTIDDIFTEVNKKLLLLGITQEKDIRNISNQMVINPQILSIGTKRWALVQWNQDVTKIKKTIRQFLLQNGVPLSKSEIIKGIHGKYPHIKESSILSTISSKSFYVLNDGRVIVEEWKTKYVNEIALKKERVDFDQLIIDAYMYYGINELTEDQLWTYIRPIFGQDRTQLKHYMRRKKYIYCNDDDKEKTIWILRKDFDEILSKTRGRKIKKIEDLAVEMLYANQGKMNYSELCTKIASEYNYNKITIYAALNDSRFEKRGEGKFALINIRTIYSKNNLLTTIDEKQFDEFIMKTKKILTCTVVLRAV